MRGRLGSLITVVEKGLIDAASVVVCPATVPEIEGAIDDNGRRSTGGAKGGGAAVDRRVGGPLGGAARFVPSLKRDARSADVMGGRHKADLRRRVARQQQRGTRRRRADVRPVRAASVEYCQVPFVLSAAVMAMPSESPSASLAFPEISAETNAPLLARGLH